MEEDEDYVRVGHCVIWEKGVVGIRYYNVEVTPGEEVRLVREPDNRYDQNAIRVHNIQGDQIGHMSRDKAAFLAPLLDNGQIDLEALVPAEGNIFELPLELMVFARENDVDAIVQAFSNQGLPLGNQDLGASFQMSIQSVVEEPLTGEERARIMGMRNITKVTRAVFERKHVQPGSTQEWVTWDQEGRPSPSADLDLYTLDWELYDVGLGAPMNVGYRGNLKAFRDVGVVFKGEDSVNPHIWCSGVVVEGMDGTVDHPHGFCRVGLPKVAFAYMMSKLQDLAPTITPGITETERYYWMNAEWGVKTDPCQIAYKGPQEEKETLSHLPELMRLIGSRSAVLTALISMSMYGHVAMENGRPVEDVSSRKLSVKILRGVLTSVQDIHGPAQAGSVLRPPITPSQ